MSWLAIRSRLPKLLPPSTDRMHSSGMGPKATVVVDALMSRRVLCVDLGDMVIVGPRASKAPSETVLFMAVSDVLSKSEGTPLTRR